MVSDSFESGETLPAATVVAVELETGTSQFLVYLAALARRRLTVVNTVGTNLSVFAVQVLQGILLARILGPEARGEYATIVFYTQTLTYVGLLGSLFAIARRAAQGTAPLATLRNAALRWGLVTSLTTMTMVTALALVALPADKQYLAPWCIACCLLLPWEHVRLALMAVDHGSGAFGRYNTSRFFAAAILPLMLLVVWAVGVGSVTSLTMLLIVASALALVFQFAVGGGGRLRGPRSPSMQALLYEGAPYALAMVADDLFNRLDVFLVLWFADFKVQGLYAAAVASTYLLCAVPNALALLTFNQGVKEDFRPGRRSLWSAAVGLAGFQATTGLLFAAVLAPLIILVYGTGFQEAVPLAMALLPGQAATGCGMVAEGYLRGRNRSLVGVRARLVGTVVMLGVALLLFDRWHEMSIPLAASAGRILSAVWICAVAARDLQQRGRQQMLATGGN
jgi:enterobacterial common antigen flippase